MAKAAALLDGLPVGPVCAVAAGLVQPKQAREAASGGTGELFRDPLTIDMFQQ